MYSLRPYQTYCAERYERDGKQLTLMPYGTGKTVIGVDMLRRQRNIDASGRYLVVCAKRARDQWVETIHEHISDARVVLLEGTTSAPLLRPDQKDIVVTHWEMLTRNDWLHDRVWSLAILDEVHRIRNHTRKRSKAAHRLKAIHRVGLTGSPYDRNVQEMWNVLKWLDKKSFGSRLDFVDRYCVTEKQWVGANGYDKVVGHKNLDELANRIRPFTVSIKLNDLDLRLPPVQEQMIELDMLPAQRAFYDLFDNADDILVDDVHFVPNTLAKMVRLQQIAMDPSLLGAAHDSAKLQWLDDWLEDLDHQAVVFTRFRQTALGLAAKYNAAALVGQSTGAGLEEFKRGEKQLLVGTIDSMSESLDLPMADSAVFLDQTWSSLQMDQARARTIRPALEQTSPKTIITVLASPIDRLIHTALKQKWNERQLVDMFLRTHGRV